MNTRRIVKISAYSILSLMFLLTIGVVALITFINPNTFKPMISKGVYEATGRVLKIDGDISWKLWPNIGLKIENVSLANPNGFTPANMLDMNAATVSVELLPLLDHNLIIDNITLDGLKVGLIKNGGKNNWTFTPIAKPSGAATTESGKPMQLKLSRFILMNSTFSYIDITQKKQYNIRDFSFNLEASHGGAISFDQSNQKVELSKVSFDFNRLINGELNFVANDFDKLNYQGDIDIAKFSVPALTNKLGIPIAGLKSNELVSGVTISTGFKGDLNSIVLNGFKFNLSDMVKGLLNVSVNNFSSPNYKGDIKLDEFSANSVLDKIGIANTARKDNKIFDKVLLNTKFNGTANSVNLQQLSFNFPGVLKGNANVNLQNFASPIYRGDVNLEKFSANKVLDKMNIAVPDRKGNQLLNNVLVNSKFAGTTNTIGFKELNFNFPGVVKGLVNLNVQSFSKPVYSGDIVVPKFSLNEVMAKLAMAPIDIPNKKLLDQVSLQTKFTGTTNSLNLTNLLSKVSASTFSGMLNILTFKPLNFTENIHVDKIDLSDLTEANGYKIPVTGLLASGSINNSKSGFKDMSGFSANQNLTVNNITVLGFDLDNLIDQFDNALTSTGKAVTLENMQPITHSAAVIQSVHNMQDIAAKAKSKGVKDYNKKTNFGTLQSNVVIHEGVINPSSFKLGGPSVKADGSGSVNMVNKSIDYKIVAQVVRPQKNKILNKISFPYMASGKFDNIDGTLDWVSIQGQMLQYLITQTTSQTKANVHNEVDKQIDNITGNASSPQADNLKKSAGNLINSIFK